METESKKCQRAPDCRRDGDADKSGAAAVILGAIFTAVKGVNPIQSASDLRKIRHEHDTLLTAEVGRSQSSGKPALHGPTLGAPRGYSSGLTGGGPSRSFPSPTEGHPVTHTK